MMGEPEVVDPEPLSAARLKVQRTNWHKLAGNELMKIQNKIQTDRQKKIKEKWESNRLKNLEVMKQRAEDDAGLSPHPADVIRKYNYKIRPNTQPVRKVIRVGFFHKHLQYDHMNHIDQISNMNHIKYESYDQICLQWKKRLGPNMLAKHI